MCQWRRSLKGSPPRMRGRVKVTVCQRFRAGITPRMRGRDTWDTRPCSSIGITPRMRGRGMYAMHLRRHGGSPRVCGEEQAPGRCAQTAEGSPRVCGEEIDRQGHHADDWGSPPRMRGRGPQRGPGRGAPGITPACAGKRLCYPFFLSPLWDHPRVCGEKYLRIAVLSCSWDHPACAGKRSFNGM